MLTSDLCSIYYCQKNLKFLVISTFIGYMLKYY